MPAQKKLFEFPFVTGLDAKSDPTSILPGRLIHLENMLLLKTGALIKRPGTVKFTSLDSPVGTLYTRGHITAVGRKAAYSLDEDKNQLVTQGAVDILSAHEELVTETTSEQTDSDCIERDNIVVTAWSDSRGGVWCAVKSADGVVYQPDTQLTTLGVNPRCCSVTGVIWVLWIESGAIRGARLPTSTPDLFDASVLLVTDIDTTNQYSVCEHSDERALIAWTADGTIASRRAVVAYLTGSGDLLFVSALSTLPKDFIAVSSSSGQIFVTMTLGIEIFYAWLNTTTLSIVVNSSFSGVITDGISTLTCTIVDNIGHVYYTSDISPRVDLNYVSKATVDVTGAFEFGPDVHIRRSILSSQAWSDGTHSYVNVTYPSITGLQDTYFTVRSDARTIGAYSRSGARVYTNLLPGVNRPAGKDYFRLAVNVKRVVKFNTPVTSGVGGSANFYWFNTRNLLLNNATRPDTAVVNNVGYITGAQLWSLDGLSPTEAGFHLFPDVSDSVLSGAVSGGTLPAGSYSYRVYYEWFNAQGQRERSTAIDATFTVDGTQRVRLFIPTLQHTLKSPEFGRTAVSIVVYRTEVDTAGPYLRCSSTDITDTAAVTNPYVFNDRTVDEIEFLDNLPDSTLLAREADYLSKSELENFPATNSLLLSVANNRLFTSINDRTVVASKLINPDDAVSFSSDLLQVPVPEKGGDIVTINKLNDSLVVFKEQGIYHIQGTGPDNTGVRGGFITRNVNTDLGCVSRKSVIETPVGLFFQSKKGIYLLTPGIQLEFIGAPVDPYREEITSAYTLPTENLVFFTTTSYTLVFDYYIKQWSIIPEWKAVAAAISPDSYYFLDPDGAVNKVVPGIYTDNHVPYRFKVKTSFVRDEYTQGRLRARKFLLLGRFKSSHTLRVAVYYNAREYPSYSVDLDPTRVMETNTFWGSGTSWGSGSSWGQDTGLGYTYQFAHKFRQQKCQNVALEISDVNPTGESCELSRLAFELGVYPNFALLNNNRKF